MLNSIIKYKYTVFTYSSIPQRLSLSSSLSLSRLRLLAFLSSLLPSSLDIFKQWGKNQPTNQVKSDFIVQSVKLKPCSDTFLLAWTTRSQSSSGGWILPGLFSVFFFFSIFIATRRITCVFFSSSCFLRIRFWFLLCFSLSLL